MSVKRFAVFGTGFWSRFQLAAWREIPGVECVAVCDRIRAKAESVAQDFGIASVYDDPEELLRREKLDFIDVITDVDTHERFVRLAAEYRLPVICQKPMAPSRDIAEQMVAACREASVPFFVHENWRWQTPLRHLKQVLDAAEIGTPFRARIEMMTGFPVFDNQPFLKTLDQFILTDLGSHLLDVARFLFGEMQTIYCRTQRIHTDIAGEDVASVLMTAENGMTVACNMAYASTPLEKDRFPETCVFIEADKGSIELGLDYWLRVTTPNGTLSRRVPPPRYAWADPAYDVVHASIVPCNANLLAAITGTGSAETTAEDNLKTVQLVFAAYDSAKHNTVVRLGE